MAKVTLEQVAAGLLQYVEGELLPALSGWQMWVSTAAVIMVGNGLPSALAALQENKILATLGLIDDTGHIDVESAGEALKLSIRKHGKLPLEIPILGSSFRFEESDVDTLISYISKVAA